MEVDPPCSEHSEHSDDESVALDENGLEILSSDGSDVGEDLVDFILPDDVIIPDDTPEQMPVIVHGKRIRKAPERYIDSDFAKVMFANKIEARALLGKKAAIIEHVLDDVSTTTEDSFGSESEQDESESEFETEDSEANEDSEEDSDGDDDDSGDDGDGDDDEDF